MIPPNVYLCYSPLPQERPNFTIFLCRKSECLLYKRYSCILCCISVKHSIKLGLIYERMELQGITYAANSKSEREQRALNYG